MKFIVVINPLGSRMEYFGPFYTHEVAESFGKKFGEKGSDWWIKPLWLP